ncbi:uncharacterized protein CLUP02_10744 [Colletotrichum lupini]|uniref:Uncharacterized protein n=1 Tax=Colletotrichum lupini TaxID=145971 RepID=A0A9Q8SZ16_9PEZI|nr:uncharacterized protein CLUP02_10744 [Colletotrichum lupini]UQC85247.1 hypothetical protein CLUP02_10744 [Colletotrichum lupini]
MESKRQREDSLDWESQQSEPCFSSDNHSLVSLICIALSKLQVYDCLAYILTYLFFGTEHYSLYAWLSHTFGGPHFPPVHGKQRLPRAGGWRQRLRCNVEKNRKNGLSAPERPAQRFCRTASAARSAVRRVSVLSMAGEHLGLGGGRSLSFCLVGAAAAHHTMGQGRWAKTAKGLASMKRAPAMAAFDIAQIPHLHNHRSEGGDDYAM